jgi:hypothetical protein
MLGQQARRIEQMLRVVLSEHSGWPAVIPEVEQFLRWAAKDPRSTSYE